MLQIFAFVFKQFELPNPYKQFLAIVCCKSGLYL